MYPTRASICVMKFQMTLRVKAMQALWTYEHPRAGQIRSPRPPAQFSNTPSNIHAHTPSLGEHNGEILQELGLARTK